MRDDTARRLIVNRLREDLIGPLDGAQESFTDRPTDRYLTGMLLDRKSVV